MVKLPASNIAVTPVKNLVSLWVDQTNLRNPVISLLGPLEIRFILGESTKAGSDVEKATIRYRILVIIPVVEGKYLPPQATFASLVPTMSLRVEGTLGDSQPLRFVLGRIRKTSLGRHHGSEGPKCLVIIAFGFGLVRRHEVPGLTGLVQDGLRGGFVVRRVAGVSPVIDQSTKHRASFPPVVWVAEEPWYAPGGISTIQNRWHRSMDCFGDWA